MVSFFYIVWSGVQARRFQSAYNKPICELHKEALWWILQCCFYGYSDDIISGTKRAEQQRQDTTKTISVDIDFTKKVTLTVQQKMELLYQNKNNAKFIITLMITENIEVSQAQVDADITIVRCPVEKPAFFST